MFVNVFASRPVATSHSLISPLRDGSPPPVASHLPSGLKRTAFTRSTIGDAASPIVDRVNAVRFSPDGKWLATGGGEPSRSGEIKLWEVATGRLAKTFTNIHSDAVFALDFSRDGKLLASGAADKFARITDVASGKVVKSFEGHTHHVLGVSLRADGRTL